MPTTRELLEAKYGKPSVTSNTPIQGVSVRAALEAKYKSPKTFSYDVPSVVETREQKLPRYQAEAQQAQQESASANSIPGFMGNFGKAFVSNIAPSEVGLGKSVSKIFGNQSGKYSQIIQDLNNTQVNLTKQIRSKEALGEDATNLKQIYNDNVKQLGDLGQNLSEETKLPTNWEVAGQLGGTALDLLTAGTYGKAKTAAMATGRLAPSAASLTTKAAVGAGLPELGKIAEQKASGLFTKAGALNVVKGAGIGYGFDVTQGMQGLRGEDRKEGSAFIPGMGTLIGGGIPAIQETTQSFKNVFRPDKTHLDNAVNELEQKYTEWSSGTKPGKKMVNLTAKKTEALNRAGTEGKTPQRVLAEGGIIPNTKGVKFDTFAQAEDYRNSIAPLRETNRLALKESGLSTVPTKLEELQARAIKLARTPENINSGRAAKMEKEIIKEFKILKNEYPNGQIPLGLQDDIKSARWDNVFKNKGLVDADVLKKDSEYAIAKAFQKNIEEVAQNAGHADVAQLNREIGDRLEGAKFLEFLDGKVLKGGRVGKYVGTVIGSSLGQSIPGKIVGALGGNAVADLLIKSSISSPVRRKILSKLAKEDPQAYQMTIKWLAEQDALRLNRLALPSGAGSPIHLPAEKVTTYEPQAQQINREIQKQTLLRGAGENPIPMGASQLKSPTAQQTIPAITNVSKNDITSKIPSNPTKSIKPGDNKGNIKLGTLITGALGTGAVATFNSIVGKPKQAIVENKTTEPVKGESPALENASSTAKKNFGVDVPPVLLKTVMQQESSGKVDPKNLALTMGITPAAMKALGKLAKPNDSLENVIENAANYLAMRAKHKGIDGKVTDLSKPENWSKWYVQKYVGVLPGASRRIGGQMVSYEDLVKLFNKKLKENTGE